MKSEPVLALLNGIAAVVNVALVALVATGGIDWDPGQITAVVAAVQAGANLIAVVVRANVVSPATNARQVAVALAMPPVPLP